MSDWYWSWILTAVGLLGFILAGRKVWWCWYVNIACQALWFTYAIVTEQYGFIVASMAYTVVFTKNAIAWTKEHRQTKVVEEFDFDYNTVAYRLEGKIYHTYDPRCPEYCSGQLEGCIHKERNAS